MKYLLSIFAITLVLSSCEKNDINQDITQPVVFEFEYFNHAWGYKHAGWMIDAEGTIRGFDLPEAWNFPSKSNHLSKTELMENLGQSDTLFGSVNNTTMLHHFRNRYDFEGAKLDTSDTFMADAGVGALYAYLWDTAEDKYKKVLLASKGDISVTNTSSEAKSAVRWLKDVGKETDRFFWFD